MQNLDNDTIELFLGSKHSRESLEKLYAVKAAKANPDILMNVMVFEKFCLAVNGEIPSFEHVEIPTLLEICGAFKVIEQEGIPSPAGCEAIRKYIACVAIHDGWAILPRIIDFAQTELVRIAGDIPDELRGYTPEALEKKKPWDDSDPVSMACLKMRLVADYLRGL